MKNTHRIPIIFAAILIIALLIQGCGGGAKRKISSVHGTVADIDRNVVIDADVWVGDHQTKSLVTGAFRLDDVPSGWQTIRASATVKDEQGEDQLWEGSTAVEVLENEPTMNANIVLAPAGEVATITGYVYDDADHRISGARVLVTTRILLPSESSAWDGAYGSIVAVTDDRGFYRLTDVPMGRSAVISASKVAFENGEFQLTNITDGMEVDFELTPGHVETPEAPTLEWVESWTMPNPLVRSFSATTEGNPYDAIRAYTSPRFRASLGSRKIAALALPTVRAASTGSLIEIDLYWNGLKDNLSRKLAGYAIYCSVGAADLFAIDWVRDPYANFYGDMGGEIEPNVGYCYRVSAVNVEFLDRWNRPIKEAEGVSSNEMCVTPLGSLDAGLPTNEATVTGSPLFTWQVLPGAADYRVFVYDRFPSIPLDPGDPYGGNPPSYGVDPIWPARGNEFESRVGAGSSSITYAGPALESRHTYYWVVLAEGTAGNAFSYSELRSFTAR